MKLQNVLFIATAICFYISLYSQPANSQYRKAIMESNFGYNKLQSCKSDKDCSDRSLKCFFLRFSEIPVQYCIEDCKRGGHCRNPEHKCIYINHPFARIGYCVDLMDEDVRDLPKCRASRDCKYSEGCYRIHTGGSIITRCVKDHDF